ncbi:MAG: A/G-specific adenine glycosylase [Polyangiaceae bacterium]
MATSTPTSTRDVRSALLAWFAAHRRDLPWRRARDPYAVLLSEVMLQQTRVETVIPYYERFLGRFPTLRDLAAADLDRVLEAWSGLGYYRRARSLWLGAREVVERFGGALPRTRAELESLPGIGPYSAGAIASIAYGQEEALVDGNVARVFSRLYAIDAQIGSRESVERCWAIARELVRGDAPGTLNEALMELGATVCTPKAPRCDACPVRASCAALAAGRVSELPVPKSKRASPTVSVQAFVVSDGERVLLAKRPASGLFAGLWEPPMLESEGRARRPEWLASIGAKPARSRAERVQHALTHRTLDVRISRFVAGEAPRAIPGYVDTCFEAPSGGRALSALALKVLGTRREILPGARSSKTPEDEPRPPPRRDRAVGVVRPKRARG